MSIWALGCWRLSAFFFMGYKDPIRQKQAQHEWYLRRKARRAGLAVAEAQEAISALEKEVLDSFALALPPAPADFLSIRSDGEYSYCNVCGAKLVLEVTPEQLAAHCLRHAGNAESPSIYSK